MDISDFTPEQIDKMIDGLFAKLKIQRWKPSKEELEDEITDFLNKMHCCSLATCGKDGVPRISVVDYVNDGLNIYIFTEGGQKLKNIKENNKVAVGIGVSTLSMKAVRGVNIRGTADVFTDDMPEYEEAKKLFKPVFDNFLKDTGTPLNVPKGLSKIIRIIPYEIVYYHNNRGIYAAHWKP
ncbi:MAG: pyridoxamine 5'-phosphate oxidase family protein [Candidatus Schekmanbacteria bacterium]|nr:MAG: pyridoxamine 5'-phosphate oxidase family protein [Candidatus Schekmanbacteria bacterium]